MRIACCIAKSLSVSLLLLVVLFHWGEVHAQFTQQGPRLVGNDALGAAEQGYSVDLSADGNTAIIGGHGDSPSSSTSSTALGAAWIFTRSAGVWTQQGPKLVGSGAIGPSQQGISVAISGDGNTAIVGGWGDNGGIGAAWVFTRSGGVWTQQGPKLVGTGAVAPSQQGWRVSLSADGNTAISGGFADASGVGAAWVFSRNAGAWTQQGPKLVASSASNTNQGWSVALSGDGNTAMIGGPGDGSAAGAAWIFTRGNNVWTQYGPKLVGTGGIGTSAQGSAVALSKDGDTAIVGAYGDSDRIGATWVFSRVQQSPSVSPIPTVGMIGLLALSAMLAIVGLRALRQPWASD